MTKLINKTIGQLLADRVAESGDQEAVVYKDLGIRWTYKEFYNKTADLAKGLMAIGIKKNENVAIWATNVPEWILLQFATARIGAILVTVNTSYQEQELAYLLKQSDSTHLFLIDGVKTTSYTDIARKVMASGDCPELKQLIYIGHGETPDGMTPLNRVMGRAAEISDETFTEIETALDPKDVINIQYTSGTTGFPKGVMLTHLNIVNNANQVADAMGLVNGDRLCIPVPFFHCFGCVMSTLACVTKGAVMVPIISFSPETVLRTVEEEKCTALHGVPTMFISEVNDPKINDYDLSSLRRGIMAGSTCPIEVMKQVMDKLRMTEITIAYGQTESSPVITQTRTNDPIERRVDTVGKVLPLVEAKVIDPLTGSEVPPGTQGELCTKGYLVMKGYYKNAKATDRAIDHEGWLHTGDLATVDEDGYYKITGRLKDMIIRGGENIYPREIEEFIYTHPEVLDIQVVGVPDQKFGEIVIAFVQLKEGSQLTEEELKDYCRGQISHFKIPTRIFFTNQYPMTASGKIQKYKLRELALEQISAESTRL